MQRLRGDLPSKAIECCDLKSKRIFTKKKKKMHLVLLLIFPCLVLHFILIGANLKTSHSLGCNFCCTLMFQLSTSMHWAISSPTSVDELVCRRLGYWFEHYCYFLWRIHSDHQQHFVLYFCGGPRSLPGKFSFSDKFDGREARPLKI